jgi:hypothetical protein
VEDPGVDGRVILKCISGELDEGSWTGSIWLRIDRRRGVVNAVMNLRIP